MLEEITDNNHKIKYPTTTICNYDGGDMYFLQIDNNLYRIVALDCKFYAIGIFNHSGISTSDNITEENVIEYFLKRGKIFKIKNAFSNIIETKENIKELYKYFLNNVN